MRRKKRIATGIDIGSDTIKFVQIIRDGKSFAISNCATISVKEHLKGNKLTQQPPEILSRIVKTELRRSRLIVRKPAIATSTEDILFKYFFIPKSVKKRILPLLHLILTSHSTGDIEFGFSRIQEVSRLEKNELVMVALTRNETLEYVHRFHEGLGEVINHSVPRPLALYNLVAFMKEGSEDCLHFCVDVNTDGLDMAVIAKTNVGRPMSKLAFFRSVHLKLTESDHESVMYRVICEEIQPTITACRRELQLSVFDIDQFWITGERSGEGLARYLSERLGRDVRLLDPMAAIGMRILDKKRHKGMVCNPQSMATAIGLALGMLVRLPVYIRLTPRITEIKKRNKKNLRYLKVAMFFVLATAFVILYYSYRMMDVCKKNVVKAENTLLLYVNNESKLLGIAEGQKKLGEGLKKLKNICDRDFSRQALGKLLAVKIPGNITLKNVHVMTVGGFQSFDSSRWIRLEGEVKGVEKSGNPLEILRNYVTNLEGVDGFERVQFREIKELGDRSVNFRVEFTAR